MSAFTTVTVSKDFKDKNKKASLGGVGQIPQQKNCVYIVAIWSDWKRYLLERGEICQENFKIGWLKKE